MTTESVIVGHWSLLIAESLYVSDRPDVLSFRDGLVSNETGQIGPYRIEGNTVFAPVCNNVELVINPGNSETGVEGPLLADGAVSVPANLRTSFNDGSDDLIEYVTLARLG